jgi:hypothetical protein
VCTVGREGLRLIGQEEHWKNIGCVLSDALVDCLIVELGDGCYSEHQLCEVLAGNGHLWVLGPQGCRLPMSSARWARGRACGRLALVVQVHGEVRVGCRSVGVLLPEALLCCRAQDRASFGFVRCSCRYMLGAVVEGQEGGGEGRTCAGLGRSLSLLDQLPPRSMVIDVERN